MTGEFLSALSPEGGGDENGAPKSVPAKSEINKLKEIVRGHVERAFFGTRPTISLPSMAQTWRSASRRIGVCRTRAGSRSPRNQVRFIETCASPRERTAIPIAFTAGRPPLDYLRMARAILFGDRHIRCAQGDVIGDQQLPRAHGDGAGCRMQPRGGPRQ